MRAIALLLAALGALVWGAGDARAESARRFGPYEIHYNAFNADFIPAEVARAHGLPRSKARGLLNVTVLKHRDDGTTAPAEATVAVTVTNLVGQQQTVRMRAIREPDALYYLGEFRIAGQDTYRFDVEVTPGDTARAYALKFSQELFGP